MTFAALPEKGQKVERNTCSRQGPMLGLPGLKKSQGIFLLISICLCPRGSHRGTPLHPETSLEDFRL